MKKIFTMLACFLLALSSVILVGCGNKVVEITTVYPESFKVVTVDVITLNGTTQNTYTLIKGKYNNRAVIYLEDEIVIDGGAPTTIKYLWIADNNSTTANQLLENIVYRDDPIWTAKTGDGYTYPDELELSNYLWDVKATGSYNDRYLVSSSETELVYRMNSDTIYISNDDYHLTNKRYQSGRTWTNTYSFGDYTTEIPNIADIFAAL